MKRNGFAPEEFYLIKNKNGFEESIRVGTKEELEKQRLDLENKKRFEKEDEIEQVWERVSYYIVPKQEWDLEHCPLIPVDYS